LYVKNELYILYCIIFYYYIVLLLYYIVYYYIVNLVVVLYTIIQKMYTVYIITLYYIYFDIINIKKYIRKRGSPIKIGGGGGGPLRANLTRFIFVYLRLCILYIIILYFDIKIY